MIFSQLVQKTVFVLFLVGASVAMAKVCPDNKGHDLVFPKKAELRIDSYDAKTKTYAISSLKFPGEGKSNVTAEALSAAVPKLKLKLAFLRDHPEDIVEEVYTAETDIPTLFDRELKERVGCTHK